MVNILSLIISSIIQVVAFILAFGLTIKLKAFKYKMPMAMTTIGLGLLLVRRSLEFWSLNSYLYNMEMAELLGYIDIFIPIFLSFSLIFIYKISNMVKLLETLKFKSEQKILTTILRTEEKERENLASEIHDDLGPLLSSIKLHLSAIEHHINDSGMEILQTSQSTINEAILHLRAISNRISLHVLEKFGLEKAFKNFLNKANLPEGLKIQFISSLDNQRFNYNLEVVLFRFLTTTTEEALKFDGNHEIQIDLFEINNVVYLHFRHSSSKFEPEHLLEKKDSDFIPNMLLRIKSLKGDFSIQRSGSKGTHLTVKINMKDIGNKE